MKIPHMFSAHACDTDSRVMYFIPSMTMVGSMYGGRSPISDGVMVSPKAAFTVHDARRWGREIDYKWFYSTWLMLKSWCGGSW